MKKTFPPGQFGVLQPAEATKKGLNSSYRIEYIRVGQPVEADEMFALLQDILTTGR